MTDQHTQRVVFQPTTYFAMQRGIAKMVGAVRPTLGPLPRHTMMQRSFRDKAPELLDDGATIARRIIELPERDEDVGAMLVRQVLWHVHEKVGDGTATTSVLFQSVFDLGVRYVVAGGNAMRLRQFLGDGSKLVLKLLADQSVEIEGKEMLIEPNSPSEGVGVAFIVDNGAPVEFLEMDEAGKAGKEP